MGRFVSMEERPPKVRGNYLVWRKAGKLGGMVKLSCYFWNGSGWVTPGGSPTKSVIAWNDQDAEKWREEREMVDVRMMDVRMLTLEEAVYRHGVLLQLRWERQGQTARFARRESPWLIFHSCEGEKLITISLASKEYGKTWRCFDFRSNQEQINLIPWDDGEGMWEPEEDPEG